MSAWIRQPTALALAVLLSACGGGGGGDADDTALPDVVSTPVPAADPGSALPEGWQHGAFMQIYVRAYQDSNGDGIGDLRGLISRLDYLKSLGVSGLWLMPITRSQDRDHGYAVTDYRSIEPDYGSLADLDELLAQAHARGMGVILDHVMNHSAARHPAFLHARSGRADPWRAWYVWENSAPAGWSIYGANPWYAGGAGYYFAGFWDQMPDFNLKNPAVLAWHHDHLRFWLNRGVDGFRFDAVGNLVENGPSAWENQPENRQIMGEVRRMLDGYQRRHLVCEAPASPAAYAAAEVCGSAFAFGHQHRLIAAAQGSSADVARLAADYATAPAGSAWFASNHDRFAGDRLWNQLGGDEVRMRLVAGTYLLQRGTPFIYYGEEIGLASHGGLGGDWALRTPMSWTAAAGTAGFSTTTPFRALSPNAGSRNVAAQQADAGSLLNFYRAMLALRRELPVLAQGSYEATLASGSVLQLHRRLGEQRAVQLINFGSTAAEVLVSGLPPSVTLRAHWPQDHPGVVADEAGQVRLTLPAQSMLVLAPG